MVIKALEEMDFQGHLDVIINSKFRFLKNVLKQWWKEILKKEGEAIRNIKDDLEKLEEAMEYRELDEEDVWVWEESRKEMDILNSCHIMDLKQKSRVRWVVDGD